MNVLVRFLMQHSVQTCMLELLVSLPGSAHVRTRNCMGRVPSRVLNLGGEHCLGGSGGSPSLVLHVIKIWKWGSPWEQGCDDATVHIGLSWVWPMQIVILYMYNCYILALVLAAIYVCTTKYSRVDTCTLTHDMMVSSWSCKSPNPVWQCSLLSVEAWHGSQLCTALCGLLLRNRQLTSCGWIMSLIEAYEVPVITDWVYTTSLPPVAIDNLPEYIASTCIPRVFLVKRGNEPGDETKFNRKHCANQMWSHTYIITDLNI